MTLNAFWIRAGPASAARFATALVLGLIAQGFCSSRVLGTLRLHPKLFGGIASQLRVKSWPNLSPLVRPLLL
jgi:hypothetical protein